MTLALVLMTIAAAVAAVSFGTLIYRFRQDARRRPDDDRATRWSRP